MSRTTSIEWTEHTWNPFVGCSIESAGCKNCYAMRLANRIQSFGTESYKGTVANVNGNAVWTGKINRSSESAMRKPFNIKQPSMIFVNSMSDFFHENATDQWRIEALNVMSKCNHHVFQVLTKRPQNINQFLIRCRQSIPDNVWIGTTVEGINAVDRIKHLQDVDAKTRFLSYEPLISSIGDVDMSGVHWAISGGESGPKCRTCDAAWIREIRDQCIDQSVPHFFKQWGNYKNNPLIDSCPSGMPTKKWVEQQDPIGKGGSLIDGEHFKEWPVYLQDNQSTIPIAL